jgi:uncharacterized membrane protein
MSDTVHSFAWRFGGPLTDLSPVFAWTVLGIIALAGLASIVLGYQRTLVALPRVRRITLTSLRALVWVVLIIALAGPTRVERTYARQEIRPLAVLVDRSDSMTAPDNRGQRRLDDALRRWRSLTPVATKAFGPPRSFAFADTVVAVDAPDRPSPLATEHTRLFKALQSVLDQAPRGGWGGIVLLTDGLDTATTKPAEDLAKTIGSALAAGTPVYPLSGRNRYAGDAFISLRDLALPARVPPRSSFNLEITLDTFQPNARSLPIRLRVGDTWRSPEQITLAAGRRALAWSTEISATDEGALPLELLVGEGPAAFTSHAEVQVARPDSTRILYYQGALDWGYRFLADILRRDPAFNLTPIFNLSPIGSRVSTPTSADALAELPDTSAGLDAYDVVVLANASASQFSTAQQTALSTWVREGGVLLFLAPDDDSTRGYAGTELEKMLPVVFGRPNAPRPVDSAQTQFRQRMQQLGGSNSTEENRFANTARTKSDHPGLTAFHWEPAAAALFETGQQQLSPLFANYATVEKAKPGATVLARHPTARASSEGNERAILLAIQRYGRGQSAAFTSDALWRWKLSQASTDRHVEKFWQNLFAWLGRERPRGPRFEHAPLTARHGQEIEFRLLGGGSTAPAVSIEHVASSPSPSSEAPSQSSARLDSTGQNQDARIYRWTPPADGEWLLTATDGAGRRARHWIRVMNTTATSETSGLPADDGLLQTLAQRTGGVALRDSVPSAWREASSGREADLLREQRHPLWHGAWLLVALLLFYTTELILRRRWQLL